MNHIIESREQKQALARREYIQPRTLEQGEKQDMGIERGLRQSEGVDEKEQLRIEDLGMDVGVGVDRVRRRSIELPSYREALKEI